MDYFQSFWNNGSLSNIPLTPTMEEITLPIAMEDYSQDPNFMIYGKDMNRNPNTLQELSQIIYQKQLFLNTKKELFLKPKAEIGPTQTPFSQKSKSSFFFTVIFHIYIFIGSSVGILWLIPCVMFAVKLRKIKALVSAMILHQSKAIEAAAIEVATASLPAEQKAQTTINLPYMLDKLTAMDIPTNQITKLVCHDPWASFGITIITVI